MVLDKTVPGISAPPKSYPQFRYGSPPRRSRVLVTAPLPPYVSAVETYVIRGGQAGYERLAVLARVWQPTTIALFDRAGVGPGMRCLDVGCGGGAVTLDLARRVGPSGIVTGIDLDEVKLGLARVAAAEESLTNVDFRAMNVYELTDEQSFDVVYCRFVLQHLERPVGVLRAMWSAVRPGGVLVVEDADFDGLFCDPPNDGFAFYARSYQQVLAHHGGNPVIGRTLHRLFTEAGVPPPEFDVAVSVGRDGDIKGLALLTLAATGELIVQDGIATQADVDAAAASLAEFVADDTTVIGSPRNFQAWSRRPLS